jgi:NAD(P)-dependent dehydrogenase (short-subunit alcohol dehydrogenase family)
MSKPGRLQGKVAIVTGAAQGIGAEYARALSAEGAAVIAADVLDAHPVALAINEKGEKALAVHCDVTDPVSVKAMVATTLDRFGRLDILVNNAALFGTVSRKRFEEIESAEWDRMMAVNVRGVFECVKAVAPAMRSQKYGKIVNIASGTVFKGQTMLLHYVTSKGAIVGTRTGRRWDPRQYTGAGTGNERERAEQLVCRQGAGHREYACDQTRIDTGRPVRHPDLFMLAR